MSINFSDTLENISGLHKLPWKLSENYLRPLKDGLFRGQNYFVVPSQGNFYIEPSNNRQNFFLKALIIASYATIIILPALVATFVIAAETPLLVAACFVGALPILTAIAISSLYRCATPLNEKEEEIIRQLPQVTHQEATHFNAIIRNVRERIENGEEKLEEALTCRSNFEIYSASEDNSPVFLIDDGGISMSLNQAGEWQIRNLDKPKSIISNETLDQFTYSANTGHITQLRYNEQNKEVYWEEPITKARLGKEGFTQPYFCPLDGLTYDLNALRKNIDNQVKQNSSNRRRVRDQIVITSPGNPNIKFKLGDLVLYPNTTLHTFAELKQPEYKAVRF